MHELQLGSAEIQVGTDILSMNLRIAEANKQLLSSHGVKSYDIMGSIGSGKTLLIERMAELLAAGAKPKKRRLNCGVIAGDVAGNDDCIRFQRRGLRAVNVNTGKECHLDAHMIQHALEEFNLDEIDVLFIENVGNLVCPVDFPLGTDKRIVVISVTEGDDMVRKHPLIFALADAIVINKIDLAEVMEVDPEVIKSDAERIRSDAKVVLTDAKHGEGITDLMNLIDL